MKTISVEYNLQNLTQSAEANLSDLFIILLSVFFIERNDSSASKYTLNKLFPYIFDKLENQNKLEKITIFNLPFYKMSYGHYNKSLCLKYIKQLSQAELINEANNILYTLTGKGKTLISEYYQEKKNTPEVKEFKEIVDEFTNKFIKGRNNFQIYSNLSSFSHTLLVEDNGNTISVDKLPVNDSKAISYNSKNFKHGKRSDLVSRSYLTKLSYELQNMEKASEEDFSLANELLSTI